ncbi:MAG: DNA-binding protein [Thiotrichales bacterium]|nr:MAG: DNA-binding protein [Thiotrichales bacterium]
MFTPQEMALRIAHLAQAKRLAINFSQKTLSERSGVSFGVIKKFERTGKISLESLLKIALALDALSEFNELFKASDNLNSLDALLQEKTRKRGRL